MVRLTRHPTGPRLELLGFRIHHGLAGMIGLVLCLWAVWHDRRDFREWLRLR